MTRHVDTGRPGTEVERTAIRPPLPDPPGTSGRPVAPHQARRAPFVALIVALLVAGLSALLGLNTATTAAAVRERSVDANNSSLNDSEQQLSRDIAALQAPQNLADQAAKLGLVPVNSPAFLRINADGSGTVMGHPVVVHKLKNTPTLVQQAQAAAKAAAAAAKAKAAAKKLAQKTKRAEAKAKAAAKAQAAAVAKAKASVDKTPARTPTVNLPTTPAKTSTPSRTPPTTPTKAPSRTPSTTNPARDHHQPTKTVTKTTARGGHR